MTLTLEALPDSTGLAGQDLSPAVLLALAYKAREANVSAMQTSEAAGAANGVVAWKRVSDTEMMGSHYLEAVIDALEKNDATTLTFYPRRNPQAFIRSLTQLLYPELGEDTPEFSEKVRAVSETLNQVTKGLIAPITR